MNTLDDLTALIKDYNRGSFDPVGVTVFANGSSVIVSADTGEVVKICKDFKQLEKYLKTVK